MRGANQKVFVVYNPKAGREDQADEVRAAIAHHFAAPRWTPEIYETTGTEDLASVCRRACQRGAAVVIAAGGDGTLVGVANGLVNSSVPLGILPMGTGNYLARALLVPPKLNAALELIAGAHSVHQVDGMKVGDRCYFSNVSVGVSPGAIRDTSAAGKRIFGRLAYVMAIVKQSSIFRLRRYKLTIDGRTRLLRATEIVVSSTTLLLKPPSLFGPPDTLADGRLEVYVVSARTLPDYVRLVGSLLLRPGRAATKLSHWTARQSVRIDAIRGSPLVQGDGEVIGRAPATIQVIAKALRVIMPRHAAG